MLLTMHCFPASHFLRKLSFVLKFRNTSFTTRDGNNDFHTDANCAVRFKGGWWYSDCHAANANGLYQGGGPAQA